MVTTLSYEENSWIHLDRPFMLDAGAEVPAGLTSQLEINATCVLIDTNGKVAHSVYAHDMTSPDRAVTYLGYRQQNFGPNQGESFQLKLAELDPTIAAVYLLLSSHPLEQFSAATAAFLDLHYGAEETAEHWAHYQQPVVENSRGTLLARLVKYDQRYWNLQTLRFGFYAESVNELAGKAAEHWGWYPPQTV